MAAKQRFPWIAVSASATLVLILVVSGLRVPESADESMDQAKLPSLGLTRVGSEASAELLAEQLAAYDPTPMFIPSAMNSSSPVIPPEARPGAGGPFAALPPDLTKSGALKFPVLVPIPANSVDGLRLTERADAAMAVGRMDTVGKEVYSRAGQVEAIAVSDNRRALRLDLPAILELPSNDWQPLELMGSVNRAGLVGELVVVVSSGSEEIDNFFRHHLRKNVRIDARLLPGFYTFQVGP
jgi:hypothetical protein